MWWSPCPSRECPEEGEIDIVIDQCVDHCLLLEQNPKIETIAPPTKAPIGLPPDNGDVDDLNFHLNSKRKLKDGKGQYYASTIPPSLVSSTEISCTYIGHND